MFEFFSKKKFLVDYLGNFVDIHNHILPGIDDGAENTDASVALIKEFGQIGVSNFIATPHIMHNFYDNTPESIAQSLQELKGVLLTEKIKDVSIEAAAEHMIDDNFEVLIRDGNIMPLRKEYLLVEMSFLQPSINFDTAIEKSMASGYFPILAHPERYAYFGTGIGKYRALREKGILLQLNLLSLGNYYGKEVNKMAFLLLQNRYVDFLASDAHHLHHLEQLKEIQLSAKHIDWLLPVIESTIETFY